MSAPPIAPSAEASFWTCPFCSLLCDGLAMPQADATELSSTACPRAAAAWRAHGRPGTVSASVDGAATSTAAALQAAAQRLAAMQQPLFGGSATDVAGARALYRLAARCGAICDHADGPALMHGVRAVQDRGQNIATLGELRTRAHTLVAVGTPVTARYPEFFRRIGWGEPGHPGRHLVFLGATLPDGLAADALPGSDDLLADVQQLGALVAGQRVRTPDPSLAALAEQLRASPYAVLVWEGGTLPAQGALVVEALNRIVATLNRSTRAATLALGGNDGAASVNQTLTWLSGLPLRTRVAASGLQHEPHRFDTLRLLANGGADGLLWVHSFDPARLPPSTTLPRIVLGPPAMAARLREAGLVANTVFLPVATPGLNAPGHLFRTDGPVVLPLAAARDDGLPGVAQTLTALLDLIGARA
jgi:formylmethanofuran dehydrogenase subunit B